MTTPSRFALIADINTLLVAAGKKPIKSIHSVADGIKRLDALRAASHAPVAPKLEPEIVVSPKLEPEVRRASKPSTIDAVPRERQVHTIERSDKHTKGINENDLRRLVPAVFAEVPHAKVSDKYQFVNTWGLVKPILDSGFIVTKATQGGTNARSVNAVSLTTQHMLRLRHAGMDAPIVGEAVPELIVINGHNGVTKFHMRGGIYRFVCANGMVIGLDAMVYESRHIGDVSAIVTEAGLLIKRIQQLNVSVTAWGKLQLSKSVAFDYARKSAEIAYGADTAKGIDPTSLLQARRDTDKKLDLWHVFNTVQENIMRGGIEYRTASNRPLQTRGVTRIGRDIGINTELWALAEEAYAENAA